MKLVFLVPGGKGCLLLGIKVLGVYLFSLAVIFYLLGRSGFSFQHPFKNFLTKELIDHPKVARSLEGYTRSARFVVSHGVSTVVASAVAVVIYLLSYPLSKETNVYNFLLSLRDSLNLQVDKLAYLDLPVEVRQLQEETYRTTYTLYHKTGTILGGSPWGPPQFVPSNSLGWILLFGVVVSLLRSRGVKLRVYALLLPEVHKLPYATLIKLIYPFAVVAVGALFLTRWLRSGLTVTDYVGGVLFPAGVTPAEVVVQLNRYRWYTLGVTLGGTCFFLADGVAFFLTFQSYRFVDTGGDLLRGSLPSMEIFVENFKHLPEVQGLGQQYVDLIEQVESLQTKLEPYYLGGELSFGVSRWVPLGRAFFSLILTLGVIFFISRGRQRVVPPGLPRPTGKPWARSPLLKRFSPPRGRRYSTSSNPWGNFLPRLTPTSDHPFRKFSKVPFLVGLGWTVVEGNLQNFDARVLTMYGTIYVVTHLKDQLWVFPPPYYAFFYFSILPVVAACIGILPSWSRDGPVDVISRVFAWSLWGYGAMYLLGWLAVELTRKGKYPATHFGLPPRVTLLGMLPFFQSGRKLPRESGPEIAVCGAVLTGVFVHALREARLSIEAQRVKNDGLRAENEKLLVNLQEREADLEDRKLNLEERKLNYQIKLDELERHEKLKPKGWFGSKPKDDEIKLNSPLEGELSQGFMVTLFSPGVCFGVAVVGDLAWWSLCVSVGVGYLIGWVTPKYPFLAALLLVGRHLTNPVTLFDSWGWLTLFGGGVLFFRVAKLLILSSRTLPSGLTFSLTGRESQTPTLGVYLVVKFIRLGDSFFQVFVRLACCWPSRFKSYCASPLMYPPQRRRFVNLVNPREQK